MKDTYILLLVDSEKTSSSVQKNRPSPNDNILEGVEDNRKRIDLKKQC